MAAERLGRLVGKRKLARRQQLDPFHWLLRALGFRIEAADRLHLVVEQLDAIRLGAAHREDVEQRAAHREVAGLGHLRHVAVTAGLQPALFGDQIELLALRQHQSGAGDMRARRDPLHQRGHRHHQHTALHRGQPVQRGDALRDDLRMRAEDVVGQRLPIREMQHRQAAGEDLQLRFQRVRALRVARHRHQQATVAARRFGDQQRAGGTVWRGPVAALPRRGGQGRMRNQAGHRERGFRAPPSGRAGESGQV